MAQKPRGCPRRLRRFDKRGAEPLQNAEVAPDFTLGALSVPTFPEANYEVIFAQSFSQIQIAVSTVAAQFLICSFVCQELCTAICGRVNSLSNTIPRILGCL